MMGVYNNRLKKKFRGIFLDPSSRFNLGFVSGWGYYKGLLLLLYKCGGLMRRTVPVSCFAFFIFGGGIII